MKGFETMPQSTNPEDKNLPLAKEKTMGEEVDLSKMGKELEFSLLDPAEQVKEFLNLSPEWREWEAASKTTEHQRIEASRENVLKKLDELRSKVSGNEKLFKAIALITVELEKGAGHA